MGKRLFYWELAGALFTAAMGTLLHFVYDWSGGWGAAAAFSAVNESTWEHMKLLFFPSMVSLIVPLIYFSLKMKVTFADSPLPKQAI